jgi:hypothetical protein
MIKNCFRPDDYQAAGDGRYVRFLFSYSDYGFGSFTQPEAYQIPSGDFDLVLRLVKDDVKKMIQGIEGSRFHENPRHTMKEAAAGRCYTILLQIRMTPPQSKYNDSWAEINVSRSTVPNAEW